MPRLPKLTVEREDSEAKVALRSYIDRVSGDPSHSYRVILIATLILTLFGLVMVFSASTIMDLSADKNPYLSFLKPAAIVVFAVILMFMLSRLRIRALFIFGWVLYALALLMQLVVLFTPLGTEVNGNRNWLDIGIGFQIQPSEPLKLGLALVLAYLISRPGFDITSLKQVMLYIALPSAAAIATVGGGGDLGTVLIFIAMVATVLFVFGAPKKWFFFGSAALIMVLTAAIVSSPSRRRRVASFLPGGEVDPLGADLQSIRAQYGLGTGGLTGIGPGASRQKWNYLPEAHTDFILAILGEEFGLVGTLLVIGLFVLLGYGLVTLIKRSRSLAAQIAVTGISAWIIVQALVNIAVVIGLIPVLGIPLPLLSSGGSAMISTLMALGVALAFARAVPGAQLSLRRGSLFSKSVAATVSGENK
ncbi:MAG: putative peptidoglycan glycosyltransferase FtsW [Varibaculum sp.]|nr:putative peptidoglycan glycosyltransferase FtsW [Varibaculum sp.]